MLPDLTYMNLHSNVGIRTKVRNCCLCNSNVTFVRALSEEKQFFLEFKRIISSGLLNLHLLFQERCLAEESYQVNHNIPYFHLQTSFECLHLRCHLTYTGKDQHRQCCLHKIKNVLVVSYASQTWPLTLWEGSVLSFTVDCIKILSFS
jgi:hypothetical protein